MKRYESLDAWRGISAVFIVLLHMQLLNYLRIGDAFYNMALFVDFFFVLSGFVICHAYGASLRSSEDGLVFLIKRFGRVWPLHMAAILVFIAIELMKWALLRVTPLPLDGTPFTADHSISSLIANIFLFNAFGLFDALTWNEPSWSIGTEFYTYVIFVIAVLTFGASRWVFAALSLSGAIIVALFSPSYMYATYDFGFFRCLYGFFAGCIVYGLHARRTASLPAATAIEIGAVCLTALYLLVIRPTPFSLLTPLVFGAIVYIFAEERGALSQLLRRPWPQRIGLYSYSIYMTHYFVMTCCKVAFTLASKWIPGVHFRQFPTLRGPNDWTFGDVRIDSILTAVYVVIVLVLSHFTYHWIEDPCRKWFAARADGIRRPGLARPGYQAEARVLPRS